jgi:cbb3-type cytochrome oxidase subunit 3
MSADLRFFWLAFIAYSLACILYVAFLATGKKRVAHTASIVKGDRLEQH